MKKNIDIHADLLSKAQFLAEAEGTTFDALVEEGLRKVLDERGCGSSFKLRKASFHGNGLQSEAKNMSWRQVRDLSHKLEGA